MYQKLFFTSFIFICTFSACSKYKTCPVILNEAFTISNNSAACNETNNFTITFTKVENDSRCATGAACIWQGVATIKLTLKKETTEYPFTLHTLVPTVYGFNNDTVVAGYKIKLIQLDPYPVALQPNATKYKAKLIITQ
jgi:hypothetical protein